MRQHLLYKVLIEITSAQLIILLSPHLLRYLYNNLSSFKVNELLYFVIVLMNSSSKKRLYFIIGLFTNSCITSKLIQ